MRPRRAGRRPDRVLERPDGWIFEIPSFAHGSKAVARLLAERADGGATVIVGGGDSVAAVTQQGLAESDDPHLDWRRRLARFLEGRELPGVTVLQDRPVPGQGQAEAEDEGEGARMNTLIEVVDARENPRFRAATRRSRSTSCSPTARSGGRPCRRAPRPARTRRSNCATATRAAIGGKGVLRAVANVNRDDRPGALMGSTPPTRPGSMPLLIELDGTPNKAHAWAPTPSWACRWRARTRPPRPADLPLYRYLGGADATSCRCPMMNILNGGKHAGRIDRLPGVHGHAGRGRDLRRGAADGRGGLSSAARRAPARRGPYDRPSATRAVSPRRSRRTRRPSR